MDNTTKEHEASLLDAARKIFIKGVCLGYHPTTKDEGEKLANRAWECTYEAEAKKILGLK